MEITVLSKFKGMSEDLLNNGIDVRINSRGLSMYPFIWTGDRVTISPEKNLNIGDIIVFKRNDEKVCHRLMKLFETDSVRYYQTRGDSSFGFRSPRTCNRRSDSGEGSRIEGETFPFREESCF